MEENKELEDGQFNTKCYICNKEFIAEGLLGGKSVCNKCYPIWIKGVMEEREQWEKWTGRKFLDMFHENQDK